MELSHIDMLFMFRVAWYCVHFLFNATVLFFVMVRIDRSVPSKQTDPNETAAVEEKNLYKDDISRYSE